MLTCRHVDKQLNVHQLILCNKGLIRVEKNSVYLIITLFACKASVCVDNRMQNAALTNTLLPKEHEPILTFFSLRVPVEVILVYDTKGSVDTKSSSFSEMKRMNKQPLILAVCYFLVRKSASISNRGYL